MKNVKTLLAVALSIVSLMGLAACGSTESDTPATSAPATNNSYTNSSENLNEQNATTETKPVNIFEGLTVYYESENTEGKLTAIDTCAGMVKDEAGNVFYTDSGEKVYADENPSEYVIAQNKVYYVDRNGYIVINEGRGTYLCSDIKGDIFYTFRGMLDGSLYVLSVDEKGAMYLNSFKASGIKDDHDNEAFYVYDYNDKTFIRNVDKIAVTNTLNPYFYIEAEGKVFYQSMTGTMKVDGKQCLFFSPLNYSFDKVFDFGFNHNFTSPLFSKNANDTKLYFRDGWDSDEYAVNLPEGYKVSDIKDAIFAQTIVITMNDGTVWTGETQYTVVGTDLTKHEKLSSLADHIVSLHPSNLSGECSIMAIMDNGVIYEI